MEICKIFSFSAAHKLSNLPKGHKCSELHGHTFTVEVYITGEIDPVYGWVMDFADMREIIMPVIKKLDHKYLNDIPGLENPTSENIAIWLWKQLKSDLANLSKIIVKENPDSFVIYTGSRTHPGPQI